MPTEIQGLGYFTTAKTISFTPVHSHLARELVRSLCTGHVALSARAHGPLLAALPVNTEVSTPMDHGLPYEDLTLDTLDGVRIRAYLLLQRRYLPGDQAEGKPLVSEEDVVEADRKVKTLVNTFASRHAPQTTPCFWTVQLTTVMSFLAVCQHTSYNTHVPW